MPFPNDNRVVLAIGAGIAVVAGVVLALVLAGGGDDAPPPVTQGPGLTVDLADAPGLEPTRELRCFVNGQFVGTATLADCARRNGVATEALDVGLDETGALSAAPFVPPPALPPVQTTELQPDPEPTPSRPEPARQTDDPGPSAPRAGGAPCLRHTGSGWRSLSNDMSREACVQALYSGTCVRRPGDAQYGRWGSQTLRLVPRRVEISPDNDSFSTLAEQDSRTCQFSGL